MAANDALKQHSGVNNDDEDGVDIPGMNSQCPRPGDGVSQVPRHPQYLHTVIASEDGAAVVRTRREQVEDEAHAEASDDPLIED